MHRTYHPRARSPNKWCSVKEPERFEKEYNRVYVHVDYAIAFKHVQSVVKYSRLQKDGSVRQPYLDDILQKNVFVTIHKQNAKLDASIERRIIHDSRLIHLTRNSNHTKG